MWCHAEKFQYLDDLVVNRILLEVQGATDSRKRKLKIRWKGYGPDDTWEALNNLHPDLINEFVLTNDLYDHNWHGSRYPHLR